MSETTVRAEYTIPVKFDSAQCLVDHRDRCIDLNENITVKNGGIFLKDHNIRMF